MAHHPQLSWLLGPASGRVCVPLRHPSYRFLLPSSPENLKILVDTELITAVNILLLPCYDKDLQD